MQAIVIRGNTARLWLDAEGELCDAIGRRLTLTDPEDRSDECELASYVAAWLENAAGRDGPTSYRDIHPDLRALVYSMAPSVIVGREEH